MEVAHQLTAEKAQAGSALYVYWPLHPHFQSGDSIVAAAPGNHEHSKAKQPTNRISFMPLKKKISHAPHGPQCENLGSSEHGKPLGWKLAGNF